MAAADLINTFHECWIVEVDASDVVVTRVDANRQGDGKLLVHFGVACCGERVQIVLAGATFHGCLSPAAAARIEVVDNQRCQRKRRGNVSVEAVATFGERCLVLTANSVTLTPGRG